MSGGISVVRKVAATFRTPFQGGPRMADSEPLIERLAAENHEFRKLREEHKKYEEELAGLNTRGFLTTVELAGLNTRGFLTTDQQWRVSELKKLKLIAKDRMEAILRQARAGAPARRGPPSTSVNDLLPGEARFSWPFPPHPGG